LAGLVHAIATEQATKKFIKVELVGHVGCLFASPQKSYSQHTTSVKVGAPSRHNDKNEVRNVVRPRVQRRLEVCNATTLEQHLVLLWIGDRKERIWGLAAHDSARRLSLSLSPTIVQLGSCS